MSWNSFHGLSSFFYDYKQTDGRKELTQLALCKSEEEPRADVAVEDLVNFLFVRKEQ